MLFIEMFMLPLPVHAQVLASAIASAVAPNRVAASSLARNEGGARHLFGLSVFVCHYVVICFLNMPSLHKKVLT